MPIWNVVVPVLANIEAESAEAAESKLQLALQALGFEPYDHTGRCPELDSFVAEDGTEADELPTLATLAKSHGYR